MNIRRYISTLCLVILLWGMGMEKGWSQTPNRPVPPGFPEYEFLQYGAPADGYFLTGPWGTSSVGSFHNALAMLDGAGYLVWFSETNGKVFDFKWHPEGFYTYNEGNLLGLDASWFILDSNFQRIDSFQVQGGMETDNHDFMVLQNGNYLFGGLQDSIMDLSALTFNGQPGDPNTVVIGFQLQEFDPQHNLIWQWSSFDHVFFSEWYEEFGYNPNGWRYCQGNAWEQDTDGNYLVSFRALNSIFKIDAVTGQVMWRLGGKASDFTFPNDSAFSGQHDVRLLPNGHLTLFDNANTAPAPTRFSRGVEYQLDFQNWTATRTWAYAYNVPMFSPAMGGYHPQPNGDALLSWGNTRRPDPTFTLIDAALNVRADCRFPDTYMTYRTFLQTPSFLPERPEVTCQEGATLELIAPPGHASYLWNTGATTSTITVTDTGTYQVFVPAGVGMLASEPIHIAGFPLACPVVGLTPPMAAPKELLGIYDVQGRRVKAVQRGQVFIRKYADGTYEKVVQF
ncbi:MAG: arylsulfotransferase family protein [Bacteroidota bacterium]